jgi:hypothetical protein
MSRQLTDDQNQRRILLCRHSLTRYEEDQFHRVLDTITNEGYDSKANTYSKQKEWCLFSS